MNINKILSLVDHTLLSQTATMEQIEKLCDEGIQYEVASVCIPPSFVSRAKAYVGDKLPICTVIGFPNGYMTTAAKVFEAKNAVENGADEIDMVINLGDVKDQQYDVVLDEIKQIRRVCERKILKVIVEACLLTEDEKIKMCRIVTASGADYIKTSTGFSTGGATKEDLLLFAANIGKGVKIKAAGGIKSLKIAEEFINIGASRLGTSSIIKLMKDENLLPLKKEMK